MVLFPSFCSITRINKCHSWKSWYLCIFKRGEDTLTVEAGFRFRKKLQRMGDGGEGRGGCHQGNFVPHQGTPPTQSPTRTISKSQKTISTKAENPKWQLRSPDYRIRNYIVQNPSPSSAGHTRWIADGYRLRRRQKFLRTYHPRLLLSFVSWALVWVRHDHGSRFSENHSGRGEEEVQRAPPALNENGSGGGVKWWVFELTRERRFLNERNISNLMLPTATPWWKNGCLFVADIRID